MAGMSTRSMFGQQVYSKRESAPAYGFGSSTRDGCAKVFLSREHAKLSAPAASPGPSAYTLRSSVGQQADGRKLSSPQWVMGTAERFSYEKRSTANPGPGAYNAHPGIGPQVSSRQPQAPIFGFGSSTRDNVKKVFVSQEHNKALFGMNSPSPSTYSLRGSVGRQDTSKRANQPTWVFGTTKRFQYDHVKRAAVSPGPGAYTLGQSVGPQVASTRVSSSMYGFGTSDRQHMSKVYVSPEHEKMNFGKQSPGPCTYTLAPSTGRQPLSSKRDTPSWGFGTANRWTSDKMAQRAASTPGPGAYCV